MSTSAIRQTQITFAGDVTLTNTQAANNPTSPASETLVSLANGDNTITVPATGAPATACVIVKPAGNSVAIKLKGIAGDTGILLHKTDHDVISLDPGQASFVLNAAAQINGVRLFWI